MHDEMERAAVLCGPQYCWCDSGVHGGTADCQSERGDGTNAHTEVTYSIAQPSRSVFNECVVASCVPAVDTVCIVCFKGPIL